MMNWMKENHKKKIFRQSGKQSSSLAVLLLRCPHPEFLAWARLALADHVVEVGVPEKEVRRSPMMRLVKIGKSDGRDLLPRV